MFYVVYLFYSSICPLVWNQNYFWKTKQCNYLRVLTLFCLFFFQWSIYSLKFSNRMDIWKFMLLLEFQDFKRFEFERREDVKRCKRTGVLLNSITNCIILQHFVTWILTPIAWFNWSSICWYTHTLWH